MSNNLFSQQLSLSYMQMDQMEPVSGQMDSSTSNMHVEMVGPVSSVPASFQFPVTTQPIGAPSQPGSQNLTPNMRSVQVERKVDYMGLGDFFMPTQSIGEVNVMMNNIGSQKSLLPTKRKAYVEPLFFNSVARPSSVPNSHVMPMGSSLYSPKLPQQSVLNKRPVPIQAVSGTQNSQSSTAPNKRMSRNESISGKSGSQRAQTPKGRTVQGGPSLKVHSETFGAVRMKMRESLAAALALACQHQDNDPKEEKGAKEPHSLLQIQGDFQPAGSTLSPTDVASFAPQNPTNVLSSKESGSVNKSIYDQNASGKVLTSESMENLAQTYEPGAHGFQYSTFFPHGDLSFSDNFFVRDELLQGNGLSWALDTAMEATDTKEVQVLKKHMVLKDDVVGDVGKKSVQSPQVLALKIEAELLKVFGGVNKKYKEKGRSLMFNLKDHNNPELRERVLSGEISPERLCSMTAEELASKELSEWRIAKAEELAHMVVLPDSDVDIRRLVKKSHKGEYQLEVENDNGVSEEVSVGPTSLIQHRLKNKAGAHPPTETAEVEDGTNINEEKNILEKQVVSSSLTIPNDGTDFMQGLMVEELKDAEYLPPVVTLDQFMESLDSEPPFENLHANAGQTAPLSDKTNLETKNELGPSALNSEDLAGTTPNRAGKVGAKLTKLEVDVESCDSPVEKKKSPVLASIDEHVWEGALQLSITALVTVIGFFRSGEKTSTKVWASPLEIKGRVRLDAFERFLHDLPMSRSRALMVVYFVLKEGSSEDDRASLSEMVDSYVLDDRLGFAEPAPGVEVYLCPPRGRTLELLCKHLSKDPNEIFNSLVNGLIGVVVWRKSHLISTLSPNSSSHSKPGLTKHRLLENVGNANVNFTSKAPILFGPPRNNPQSLINVVVDDDDDDVPPGFGPVATRDDDDLPEFTFSGSVNPSVPYFSGQNQSQNSSRLAHGNSPFQTMSIPPTQIRELILKYGNTDSTNLQGKRGSSDNANDIPEWHAEAHRQQLFSHGFQHPSNQAVMVNMQPFQNVAPSWNQQHITTNQPAVGQYHGMAVNVVPGMNPGQGHHQSRGF